MAISQLAPLAKEVIPLAAPLIESGVNFEIAKKKSLIKHHSKGMFEGLMGILFGIPAMVPIAIITIIVFLVALIVAITMAWNGYRLKPIPSMIK